MKIGQRRTQISRNLLWLVALTLTFVVGLWAGSQGWHEELRQFQSVPARIVQWITPPEDLPTLAVDMRFANYNRILGQREQALQAGVFIPSQQDFMTATIRLDHTAIPVRMRLLEGRADNLGEDEKWGFEVRTRQNQHLLGMQRFYLSDPEVNNWLHLWAFARALEREDVLVSRCQFVRLIFNGNYRGIYTLQEGFADEMLTTRDRPVGVIVRFDADLLWESIAHFDGDTQAAYADPVTNLSTTDFQYFEVDTFRDAAIAKDPDLIAQRDAAIGLLRALQTGTLDASDVFDVERYGRFLALADLWAATPATSLVNLHYYYNPTSNRLEPIGFNANPLSSDDRLSLAATYDDPVLQAAYVREAWRVSQPQYLDQLQAALEPEFRRLQQAVGAERKELKPPWDELRNRQRQIRRSLNPVQPVFAHLGSPTLATSGTLRVEVANVLNLPVELVGFDIHGATFLPANPQWLQNGSAELLVGSEEDGVILRALDTTRAPVIQYVRFDIPLIEIHRRDNELDFMQEIDVQVATRILGLSNTQFTLAQRGHSGVFPLETQP